MNDTNPLALADSFSEAEQKAIADYIGVPVSDPAFLPMLGIAKHLGLSPVLGEIWLIESERFNRATATWEECLRPAVGRDGFLKHARSNENFLTVRSNFVCANDHFSFRDDGKEVVIDHSATLTPDEAETPPEAKERAQEGRPSIAEADSRGPVLGAWAKVFYRDEAPPFFYYARVSEHGKTRRSGRDGEEAQEDWAGAWSYTAAMISKCAQSYALRIGMGISGVVPADELSPSADSGLQVAGRSQAKHDTETSNASIVQAMENVDEQTKGRLIAALEKVNQLSPFSWATAKVAVMLEGADQAVAERVLSQVREEIQKLEANIGA